MSTSSDDKTTAGNYFISNYPPYSFWSPEDVHLANEGFAVPPTPGTPLGLYIHIPFCRKRCHFCYFKVYTDKNSADIRSYANAAVQEMSLYAQQPAIQGRKPHFVYFGGGTPSYLSSKQLIELTDELKQIMPWDDAVEVAFEAEPGTLSESKLKTLKDIGVTRLSLGFENFDDHILGINGRAHRSKEIFKIYDLVQQVGYDQINIDLIAGMLDETDENWAKVIETAKDMAPDSITVYQMEVPYNTTIYKRMKENKALTAPVADWPTKRRWTQMLFDAFVELGYDQGSAYTIVKDKANTQFVYRDALWEGADLLALGVASFGHINGVHYQNQHDLDDYLAHIDKQQLPLFRALKPTEDELFIREFILKQKLGFHDPKPFIDKFGIDPTQRFESEFKSLVDDGFITKEGEGYRYTTEGLLRVDESLHRFFLPQHKDARYA